MVKFFIFASKTKKTLKEHREKAHNIVIDSDSDSSSEIEFKNTTNGIGYTIQTIKKPIVQPSNLHLNTTRTISNDIKNEVSPTISSPYRGQTQNEQTHIKIELSSDDSSDMSDISSIGSSSSSSSDSQVSYTSTYHPPRTVKIKTEKRVFRPSHNYERQTVTNNRNSIVTIKKEPEADTFPCTYGNCKKIYLQRISLKYSK